MSFKNETATLEVRLSADQAKNQIKELKAEAVRLTAELDKVGQGDPAKRKQLKEELAGVKQQIKDIKASVKENIQVIINGKVAGQTLSDLGAATRVLRSEVKHLADGTTEFAMKSAQLRKVTDQIDLMNAKIKGTDGMFSKVKDEIKAFGVVAAGYLGFQALTSQVTNIIAANAKLSDSLANIRMTAGLSAAEVQKLNAGLSAMPTRTATQELREIAAVAGQFGVAKDEILEFTDAVNQSVVVLGSEFGGGAKQVTTVLATLRNVLTDIKTDNISEDMMHIGNALVTLAQQGVATAPVVADFANRIAGTGRQAGLTSGQILGISATLQELGVTAERGGTAVSRTLLKMSQDADQFAKVAGMSTEEYTELLNKDAYQAFMKFIDGTRKAGASQTEFAAILKDSELSGAGASEILAKLGANHDILTERVKLATDALKVTTAITEQYKLKNETLGAELDKLSKKFYALVSGETVNNFVRGLVRGLTDMFDVLGRLPEIIKENTTTLMALAAITALYYGRVIQATIASIANTTAELARNVAYEAGFKWIQLKEAATKAYAFTTEVLTGKIKLAEAATRIWNATMAANPVGLIIAGFIALVGAIELYRRNTAEAIKLESDKASLSRDLVKINADLKTSQDSINAAIENFNSLSPEEQENLRKSIALKREEAQAQLESVTARQKDIQERSTDVGTWEALWNVIKNGGNTAAAALDNIKDAVENGNDAAAVYSDQIIALGNSVQKLSAEEQKILAIQNAERNAMAMQTITTENYNEKLRLLRIALNNAAVGGEAYKRILKEIADTQNQLNSGSMSKEQDEELKKRAAAMLQMTKELRDARIKLMDDGRAKEIAIENARYADEVERIKKTEANEKLKNIRLEVEEELHAKAKNDIHLKYDEKDFEAFTDKLLKEAAAEDKAREEQEKKDREAIQRWIDREEERLAIKMRLAQDDSFAMEQVTIAQIEMERDRKLDFYKNDAEMRALINADADKAIEDAHLAHVQRMVEQTAEYYTMFMNIVNTFNQMSFDQQNKELSDYQKANEKKKKALKNRLDNDLISEEQYNKEIEALDAQYEKKAAAIKRDQFMKQQQADVIQSIINTAVAVTKALPNVPLAVLTGVLGAAQTMLIASKPVPEFGSGGKFEGIVNGPSHAQGGVDIVSGGRKVAEIEGNEVILSEKTYRKNKVIVDALLEQSMHSNGDPIPWLENGGWIEAVERSGSDAEETEQLMALANLLQNKGGKVLVNVITASSPPAPLQVERGGIQTPGDTGAKVLVNRAATPKSPEGDFISQPLGGGSTGAKVLVNRVAGMTDEDKADVLVAALLQSTLFSNVIQMPVINRPAAFGLSAQTISEVLSPRKETAVERTESVAAKTKAGADVSADYINELREVKSEIKLMRENFENMKLRAYVVHQDIKDAEELDQRIKENAMLSN